MPRDDLDSGRTVSKRRAATQSGSHSSRRMQSWLSDHRRVARDAFQRLRIKPLGSLVTCLVVGIALALPAGFFIGLDNLQRLASGWNGAARMSVFLHDSVSAESGQALASQLMSRPGVGEVVYLSQAQALAEFRQLSGFGDLLDALPANPLPAVLVITPLLSSGDSQLMHGLQFELEGRAEVELVQLDLAWIQRLFAVLEFVRQLTLALAMLLGAGVLLVTGNTIRLAIESRRSEIVVAKLVGGTDAFVRRPFLYTGVWYGLGGGMLACLLMVWLWYLLDGPVNELVSLYGGAFSLRGLAFGDVLALVLGGAILGWGGAWLAVSRHLGEIEPR